LRAAAQTRWKSAPARDAQDDRLAGCRAIPRRWNSYGWRCAPGQDDRGQSARRQRARPAGGTLRTRPARVATLGLSSPTKPPQSALYSQTPLGSVCRGQTSNLLLLSFIEQIELFSAGHRNPRSKRHGRVMRSGGARARDHDCVAQPALAKNSLPRRSASSRLRSSLWVASDQV